MMLGMVTASYETSELIPLRVRWMFEGRVNTDLN